jgi:hypothetical protein
VIAPRSTSWHTKRGSPSRVAETNYKNKSIHKKIKKCEKLEKIEVRKN